METRNNQPESQKNHIAEEPTAEDKHAAAERAYALQTKPKPAPGGFFSRIFGCLPTIPEVEEDLESVAESECKF